MPVQFPNAQELYAATRAKDWARAEELLRGGASVNHYEGAGSTLYNAIDREASIELLRLYLAATGIENVINGTPDSWPPLGLALTSMDAELARMLLEHDACVVHHIPWQLASFVIKESPEYSPHPKAKPDADYDAVLDVVRQLFAKSDKIEQSFDDWLADLTSRGARLADVVPPTVSFSQFEAIMPKLLQEAEMCDEPPTPEQLREMFDDSALEVDGQMVWEHDKMVAFLREEIIGGDGEVELDVALAVLQEALPPTKPLFLPN